MEIYFLEVFISPRESVWWWLLGMVVTGYHVCDAWVFLAAVGPLCKPASGQLYFFLGICVGLSTVRETAGHPGCDRSCPCTNKTSSTTQTLNGFSRLIIHTICVFHDLRPPRLRLPPLAGARSGHLEPHCTTHITSQPTIHFSFFEDDLACCVGSNPPRVVSADMYFTSIIS